MRERTLRCLSFVTGAALAVQVTLVCLQVVGEGLLSDAFTREISKYLMAWVTLLGVAWIVLERDLLAIRWWTSAPRWWRQTTRWVRLGTTLILCGVLLAFGVWNALLTLQDGKTTDALGWPKVWVTLALPVSMAVTLLALIVESRRGGRD